MYGDPLEIIEKYEDQEGYTEQQQKKRLLEILNKQAAIEEKEAGDVIVTDKKLGEDDNLKKSKLSKESKKYMKS